MLKFRDHKSTAGPGPNGDHCPRIMFFFPKEIFAVLPSSDFFQLLEINPQVSVVVTLTRRNL